jgi:hypothetical protein
MKRSLAMLLAGIVLGSTGTVTAAPSRPADSWVRNNVLCTTTGGRSGISRGIACQKIGGRKTVVVNQHSVIVGNKAGQVLYLSSP